ncbi:BCCT family transporter, partial [Idiomarina abyssalis]
MSKKEEEVLRGDKDLERERKANDPMIPDGEVNPINTDYQVGQDNVVMKFGPFGLDFHNRVFAISGLAIVAFVFITLMFQNQAEPVFTSTKDWLTANLDWFFIGAANIFVILCFFLIFSPLGNVRLGGTEASPDFSYLGWFSMLFAAGMGIGLMFYGVSEPITHFSTAL